MKAFLVGLLSLVVVIILCGLGILLLPFVALLGLFLRIILSVALIVFAVWLLGKIILVVWNKLKN